MKTVVETYLVEETIDLIHDADSLQKWGDLVAHLGLTGQTQVQKDEKSPIPFLWMNKSLIEMFSILCPSKVPIESYSKMPIPLEILDLVALSKREDYFYKIEIWFDEKTPDPVCIGYRESVESNGKDKWYLDYYAERYLIGRWSDVKASFAELIERAKKRFISEKSNELRRKIKDATRELEDIEDSADRLLGSSVVRPNDDLPF